MKLIILLGVVLGLSACGSLSTPRSLSVYQGQVQLRGAELGSSQESIINTGVQQFSTQPTCEARKVGLGNQRKAFLYEACSFMPSSQEFANAPLAEATYHFINDKLVRVDIRVKGNEQLANEIAEDFDQWLFQRLVGDANDASTLWPHQWQNANELVSVRAATGGNAGNVMVRLLQADLVQRAPWLAM
jgi:hypothetical protein